MTYLVADLPANLVADFPEKLWTKTRGFIFHRLIISFLFSIFDFQKILWTKTRGFIFLFVLYLFKNN